MAAEDVLTSGAGAAHVAESTERYVAVEPVRDDEGKAAGGQPQFSYVAPESGPADISKKAGFGYLACKRAFDVAFSAGVCVILAIPVAVACAAVSLDSPGAPFFRQKRVGKGGKPIYIFKIRSMYQDSHEHPERYLDDNQMAQWKREQKVDYDPRITRVGRVIRKTSLDELPQFLNVLAGDMSVIGPRPVTLEETFEFGADRDEVLSVRPGITGLWQSTDRNEATWENGHRQERELEYVRNQGFVMDARCFFGTFGAMFGKNKTGR